MNTVRQKLDAKLKNNEISQEEYDNLVSELEGVDMMDAVVSDKQKSTDIRVTGSKTINGGSVDNIKVAGRLHSKDNLLAENISISGRMSVDGDLSVKQNAKIAGKLEIKGDVKLVGDSRITGKLISENNVMLSHAKIAGKVITQGQLIADDEISCAGKILSKSIRSASTVKIMGGLEVDEDLFAKEFVFEGGNGIIGGNVTSEIFSVNTEYRKTELDIDEDQIDNLDSFPSMAKYLTGVIKSSLQMNRRGRSEPGELIINGNVESSNIDMSYLHVKGNVKGDNITIGNNVKIDGKILYKNDIKVPQGSEFDIEKTS